jgi:hypothetical protein
MAAHFDLNVIVVGADKFTPAQQQQAHAALSRPRDPPAMAGTLIQGPSMPGVIAVRDPFGTSCAVRFLLLTHPDGDGGFHAGVYQSGGELMYQGHARSENVTESSATLSLFALDQPGVRPISLEISVGPDGVDLLGDRLSAMEVLTDPMEPTPVDS